MSDFPGVHLKNASKDFIFFKSDHYGITRVLAPGGEVDLLPSKYDATAIGPLKDEGHDLYPEKPRLGDNSAGVTITNIGKKTLIFHPFLIPPSPAEDVVIRPGETKTLHHKRYIVTTENSDPLGQGGPEGYRGPGVEVKNESNDYIYFKAKYGAAYVLAPGGEVVLRPAKYGAAAVGPAKQKGTHLYPDEELRLGDDTRPALVVITNLGKPTLIFTSVSEPKEVIVIKHGETKGLDRTKYIVTVSA